MSWLFFLLASACVYPLSGSVGPPPLPCEEMDDPAGLPYYVNEYVWVYANDYADVGDYAYALFSPSHPYGEIYDVDSCEYLCSAYSDCLTFFSDAQYTSTVWEQ